jgi:endonuclease YncB( thermonuclease family)
MMAPAMIKMRTLMIAAALAVAMSTAAQAAGKSCPAFNKPVVKSVEGPAYVKDGDTVVVAGVTVRLKGVDAPEQADKYGPDATEGMRDIVGDWLRCGLTGEKTHDREVGYCTNAAHQDIGEAIIKKGLALACECFSDRYVPFEQPDALARLPRASYCIKDKVAVPLITPPPPTQLACLIKGNINSKGEHIYHMPGQRFYNKTDIDPSKGERWFCTEDEAIGAGWRKSKV